MRESLKLFIVLSILLTATYAIAGESLVLYDNFKKPLIDPNKWFGSEHSPNNTIREASREIKDNALHMTNRGYSANSTTDISQVQNRLRFTNADPLTKVKFTVGVKDYTTQPCTASPAIIANVYAGFVGYFFNTGTPTPGSAVGDVIAFLFVVRRTDSTDAPNVLRAVASIRQCNDSGCGSDTRLKTVDLGPVNKGQKTTLSLEWDKANHQFIAKRDKMNPISLAYTVSDTSPPGFANNKRLSILANVANCGAPPASTGFMDAYFTDVYVNSSAAIRLADLVFEESNFDVMNEPD